MRHSVGRWVLLVLAMSVAAGLAYHAGTLEQQGMDARRGLVTASGDARALQAALSDARRALAAMASPGQPAVSWSRQVGAAIEAARAQLTSLGAVPDGVNLSASIERLDRLAETEGRLREYAVGGRSLQASDVAFGEALPHLDAIDVQVADALAQLSANAEQHMAATRQQQTLALAGALGTLALAALMLTPSPRARADQTAAAPVVADGGAADLTLDLGRTAPPASVTVPTPAPAPARFTPPAFDLATVAAVCGELARLSDGAALTAVLERVAPAIGAKGIVVWLADADRHALRVAASWGYDSRIVERFPAVPVTDDNPTARAFSTRASVTAPGRSGQPAAVAAPIVGSSGATGVLSVELTSSGAPTSDVVAVAGIVAAQLATLLEPLPPAAAPAAAPNADESKAQRV